MHPKSPLLEFQITNVACKNKIYMLPQEMHGQFPTVFVLETAQMAARDLQHMIDVM